MNTRPDPKPTRYLLLLVSLVGISLLALSCSNSSPTEPDNVASTPEAGPGSSSSSSNAEDSSGDNSSGSNNGDDGSSSNSADDSGESGSSGTDGQPGSLKINLTDLPTDEICQLWVYFEELRVKPDGGPPVFVLQEFSGQTWDLLTLRNGAEDEMGEFVVEQGKYQFIEILLDQSRSSVVEKDPETECDPVGETVALQIPSQKFKVKGQPFTVDSATEITIDFDADQSLKRKGSEKNPKGWLLSPSVSIVKVDP